MKFILPLIRIWHTDYFDLTILPGYMKNLDSGKINSPGIDPGGAPLLNTKRLKNMRLCAIRFNDDYKFIKNHSIWK